MNEINTSHMIMRKINAEQIRIHDFKTNNILHLLLAVISAGLWLPVWAFVALSNGNERMKSKRRIERLERALSLSEVSA